LHWQAQKGDVECAAQWFREVDQCSAERCRVAPFVNTVLGSRTMGRGLLLWLLGIPIPVIILLFLFHVV
jgi:hypothetical protein